MDILCAFVCRYEGDARSVVCECVAWQSSEKNEKANYKYFYFIIIGILCAMYHMLSESFVFI